MTVFEKRTFEKITDISEHEFKVEVRHDGRIQFTNDHNHAHGWMVFDKESAKALAKWILQVCEE